MNGMNDFFGDILGSEPLESKNKEELIDTLIAISVVAKRLAEKIRNAPIKDT